MCKTHTFMSEVWTTRTICGYKTKLIRLHVHKHKSYTLAILKTLCEQLVSCYNKIMLRLQFHLVNLLRNLVNTCIIKPEGI